MYESTAMTKRALLSFIALAALAGCAEATIDPPAAHPPLDGEAALALVQDQVDFGPRIPGSPGHAAQLSWMLTRLASLAPEVLADTFPHVTTYGDSLTLVNVQARFRPDETRRILLLTHWDTRPRADQARDSAQRDLPVPGANDGASGTAVLMELARIFAAQAPPMGVDLLFVDGEDYGPGSQDMFLGARRYAATLPDEGRPVYGVLLDMVGDIEPRFSQEANSVGYAPIVVRKVWQAARRAGHGEFFPNTVGDPLGDDHIPLNEAGLPTVDVIDFSYGPGNGWWHTPEDTPDKVTAATLKMVAEVVAQLIYSGG